MTYIIIIQQKPNILMITRIERRLNIQRNCKGLCGESDTVIEITIISVNHNVMTNSLNRCFQQVVCNTIIYEDIAH